MCAGTLVSSPEGPMRPAPPPRAPPRSDAAAGLRPDFASVFAQPAPFIYTRSVPRSFSAKAIFLDLYPAAHLLLALVSLHYHSILPEILLQAALLFLPQKLWKSFVSNIVVR